jgi:hypothetical protein
MLRKRRMMYMKLDTVSPSLGRSSEKIPIGNKYFRWTVIDQPDPKYNIYTIACDCGTTRTINGGALLSLRSTQCIKCRRADLRKNKGHFFGAK